MHFLYAVALKMKPTIFPGSPPVRWEGSKTEKQAEARASLGSGNLIKPFLISCGGFLLTGFYQVKDLQDYFDIFDTRILY